VDATRFVGAWPVRLAALVLGVASVACWFLLAGQRTPAWVSLPLVIVLSVLAFMALVHTGRSVYALWMIVAEKIQTTVVTVLFSVTYLVLVPPVWIFAWRRDSLRLRNADESTYWVKRSGEERDAEFFQRLG